MSFQMRFCTEARVVRALFFGEVTLQDKLTCAGQMAEKYGHLRPLRVLVDVRQASMLLSGDEQRSFGLLVARRQGLKHGRFAVLHRPEFNISAVINSSGMAAGLDVGEFVTEAEALNWLNCSALISG